MRKWAVVLRYVNDKAYVYPKIASACRLQYADYEIIGYADTKKEAEVKAKGTK